MKIKPVIFTIPVISLFLFPTVALAGPICSGFMDCLPLTLKIWFFYVGPFALITFFILSFVFFKPLHLKSRLFGWLIIGLISIFATSFTYYATQTYSANKKYEKKESVKALSLSFKLYEPTYVVPEFKMTENSVINSNYFVDELEYQYYTRNMQSANYGYKVVNRISTDKSPYTPSQSLLYSAVKYKTIGNTTIYVFGTISKLEAQRVLDSLREIEASKIKFYSEWARYR